MSFYRHEFTGQIVTHNLGMYGYEIDVRFNVVDQDAVEVPDELALALDRDEAASQAWDQLTPGKRRGLAHRIASAKTAPTRSRRLAEVLDSLKSG